MCKTMSILHAGTNLGRLLMWALAAATECDKVVKKYQQRFLSSCVAYDATIEPVSMYYRLLCTISMVEKKF